MSVKPANPKACAHCPWRLANQGKRHPHGFYSKKNLQRLWAGMRRGERMSCHPTDSRMAEFEGYEQTAVRETMHECAGYLILVQRELAKFGHICKQREKLGLKDGYAVYRREHPMGLLREGLTVHSFNMAVTFPGDVPARVMDIGDQDIGYPPVGEFEPEKYADGLK